MIDSNYIYDFIAKESIKRRKNKAELYANIVWLVHFNWNVFVVQCAMNELVQFESHTGGK